MNRQPFIERFVVHRELYYKKRCDSKQNRSVSKYVL